MLTPAAIDFRWCYKLFIMLKENEIKLIKKNCKALSIITSKLYSEYSLLCKKDADEEVLESKWKEYKKASKKEIIERQKLIDENIVP